MTDNNAIEPAHTAWTACYCTILMSSFTDEITDFIIKLRREWAITNTSSVRFSYPNDLIDLGRAYTRTDTDTACRRVRRRYKRISTLVNIQHNALCAFKQHFSIFINRIVQYD
ncbi:hypothetical protein D3C78_1491580 [compost metagenome]